MGSESSATGCGRKAQTCQINAVCVHQRVQYRKWDLCLVNSFAFKIPFQNLVRCDPWAANQWETQILQGGKFHDGKSKALCSRKRLQLVQWHLISPGPRSEDINDLLFWPKPMANERERIRPATSGGGNIG